METSAPSRTKSPLNPTMLIAGAFVVVAFAFLLSNGLWYSTFKAIHVVAAVIWIGGGALLTILGIMAERQNDPQELAAIARQAAMVGKNLFSPAAGVVLLAGIAMMINGHWPWGSFWVTFGLLGFVFTFITGIAVLAPRSERANELVAEHGVEALATQAAIKQILLIARVDIVVLLLVVVDMIAKPF